ncbi:helix-turn-helix transcriptional regulator [Acetobacteraceae bacterium H6797]|nr:helix-turn-helix transcriptional regulator [Acetobacteraceae bacterium H6797]
MADADGGADIVRFGPFLFARQRRELSENGLPLRLGGRALDLLAALLEHPGEVVSKASLMKAAWPGMHVVEANLSVHMSALRRALRDGQDQARYIINEPGRGYRFVGAIDHTPNRAPVPSRSTAAPRGNLPARLTTLLGREEALDAVAAHLAGYRLVTLVGVGGIGKTALALEAARRLARDFADGAWFVSLAALQDPTPIASTLAAVLCPEVTGHPLAALTSWLREREVLLLLDNCEHLADAVAELVARLLAAAQGLRIIATSRESLRVEGEVVQQVPGLAFPPAGLILGAHDALAWPAIRLLHDRAAAQGAVAFGAIEAEAAARICRELDGMPLAIELAAARAATFGIDDLVKRLDDRFRLLNRGRRTAAPRQRSLIATLDWSHDLLSTAEQKLFRRLGIFVGGFGLDAASSVASDIDEAEIADHLAGLVMKSLVVSDVQDGKSRFRLLETTRLYALDKLEESGETTHIGQRHVAYFASLLNRPADSATLRLELDNIRAALRRSFGAEGEPTVAVTLATAAVPRFLEFSLLPEAEEWARRALEGLQPEQRGTQREMSLRLAQAAASIFSRGLTDQTHEAWRQTAALAERLGEPEQHMTALLALWTCELRTPDLAQSYRLAQRYQDVALAAGSPSGVLTSGWMLGLSLQHLGQFQRAVAHLEAFLPAEDDETMRRGWPSSERAASTGARAPWPFFRRATRFRGIAAAPGRWLHRRFRKQPKSASLFRYAKRASGRFVPAC